MADEAARRDGYANTAERRAAHERLSTGALARWMRACAEHPWRVVLGWVGIIAMPQLFSGLGVAGAVLVIVGGVVYTIGAVIYATKWPNPFPRTLGFHEIFHLLVVAAAVTQFVAVSLVVLS